MSDHTEIEPGLWMGAAITGRPDCINAILDMQAEHEDSLRPDGLHVFMWLPLLDVPEAAPDPLYIDNAVNTIIGWRKANWTTLVHCAAGRSRSGMIVVAYVMKTHKLSRDDALAFVRTKRPITDPNVGFMDSLLHYQTYLTTADS